MKDWIQNFVGKKGGSQADTRKLLRFVIRWCLHSNPSDSLSVTVTQLFEDDRWRNFYLGRKFLNQRQSIALESILSNKNEFHLNWREVKRLFHESGFQAVRTHGAVDLRLYLFLFANGIHPVAWKVSNRHADFSVDVFHEIGHAIALLDPMYCTQLQRFAKSYLRHSDRIPTRELIKNYRDLFEMSIVRSAKSLHRPIGAAMVTFEPFYSELGKIESRKEYAKHIAWYLSKKVWEERCHQLVNEWEKRAKNK